MKKSQDIKELAIALTKAQSEMAPAKKDSNNTLHKSKYADLKSVLDFCRAPLSKNGLSISQTIDNSIYNNRIEIKTILMHSSGQWISGSFSMPFVRPDPQSFCTTITQARRHALCAIVGLPTEEDGDAESAELKNGKENTDESISFDERKKMFMLKAEKNIKDEDFTKYLITTHGIDSTAKITVSMMDSIYRFINKKAKK